jgi:hypothetical protein
MNKNKDADDLDGLIDDIAGQGSPSQLPQFQYTIQQHTPP